MSSVNRILVVDDEPQVRRTVGDYLALRGFHVTLAADAAEARALLREESFDLAVLDVRMPGEDGLSLARFIREHLDTRIVMLTTEGEVIDRIVGLEVGADDYVVKPADFHELVARIQAVLRPTRSRPVAPAVEADSNSTVVGNCRLDLDRRTLSDHDGTEIPITAKDFVVLEALAANPDRVLSRNQLSRLVRGRDWEPSDRSIDIRIGRLRRKVEADPAKPQFIKTVHGVGYVLATRGD